MRELNFQPSIQALLEKIKAVLPINSPVYLVGGAIRDMLIGRPIRDLDITLPREAIRTARRLADILGADFFPLDVERDTGRIILRSRSHERIFIDFASFRGEDLIADLLDRDFTINEIAVDFNECISPFEAQQVEVPDVMDQYEESKLHERLRCYMFLFGDGFEYADEMSEKYKRGLNVQRGEVRRYRFTKGFGKKIDTGFTDVLDENVNTTVAARILRVRKIAVCFPLGSEDDLFSHCHRKVEVSLRVNRELMTVKCFFSGPPHRSAGCGEPTAQRRAQWRREMREVPCRKGN